MPSDVLQIRVTEEGAREVKRSLDDVGAAGQKAADLLKRAFGSFRVSALIGEARQLSEAYQQVQNRLRTVTTGAVGLERVQGKLLSIANNTRSGLQSTAELYARVATSANELGKSESELLGFTESLSQAIKLSGASSDEANAALVQLSQGIASGALRGDELNSVLEQLPRVADVIARSLGVTRGELKKLGEEGKLTSSVILDAFKRFGPELQAEFKKLAATPTEAFTVLRNNLTVAVGKFDQANGFSKSFAAGMLLVSQHADVLVKSTASLAFVLETTLAARAIPAAIAGLRALAMAALSNPFTAILVVLTSLIALVTQFGDQISYSPDGLVTLQDFGAATFEVLRSSAKDFIEYLQATLPQLGEWGQFLADVLKNVDFSPQSILRAIAVVGDAIIDFVRAIASAVGTLITGTFTVLETNIALAAARLEKAFPKALGGLTESLGFEPTLVKAREKVADYRQVTELIPPDPANRPYGLPPMLARLFTPFMSAQTRTVTKKVGEREDDVVRPITMQDVLGRTQLSPEFARQYSVPADYKSKMTTEAWSPLTNILNSIEVLARVKAEDREAAASVKALDDQFNKLMPDVAELGESLQTQSKTVQAILGPLKDAVTLNKLTPGSLTDPFNDKAKLFNTFARAGRDGKFAGELTEAQQTAPLQGLRTDMLKLSQEIVASEQAVTSVLNTIGEIAAGRMAKAVDVVGLKAATEIDQILERMGPKAAQQPSKLLDTLTDKNRIKVADKLAGFNGADFQRISQLIRQVENAKDQLNDVVSQTGQQAADQITQIIGTASQQSQQQLIALLSQIGTLGREKVAENFRALGTGPAKEIANILEKVDQTTVDASNTMIQEAKSVLATGASDIGVTVAVKLLASFRAAMATGAVDLQALGQNALDQVLANGRQRGSGVLAPDQPAPDIKALSDGLTRTRIQTEQLNEGLGTLKKTGTDAFNQLGNAAQSMGDKTDDIGQKLKSTFESIFGHLENALVSFVTTGKLDFKQLINSILADLARMVIQMLIIRPLMGFFGGLFGFSSGGLVPGFASGGAVRGPGTSTSDSILARLSHGEFVVNARATEQFYPLLRAINDGGALMPAGWRLPQYATGGIVGGFSTFDRSLMPTTSSNSDAGRDDYSIGQSARMTRMVADQVSSMTNRNQRTAGSSGSVVMNSTVNVNVTSRGDANADGQAVARQIDAQIKSRFIELLQNEQRPGGALSNMKVR